MKKLLRFVVGALLACCMTACPETTVNDDFGLKPAALKAADWNGSWTPADDDDDEVQFEVVEADQGKIVMTEPDRKDAKAIEFHLRRASADAKIKLVFAAAHERDAKKPGGMLFLMREADDGVIYTWSVNHEAVAAAVKAGQLQGTVRSDKEGAHSHLESVPANYVKMLEPQFWNWSEPTCLKRAKK